MSDTSPPDGPVDRGDPMGVRRRWGRRELIFLICALAVIALVALLAARGVLNRPPHGAPAGVVPAAGMQGAAAVPPASIQPKAVVPGAAPGASTP